MSKPRSHGIDVDARAEQVRDRGRRTGLFIPASLPAICQIELATELGISQRMVAYYESPVSTPPANLLPQISAALGVSIAELFGVGATLQAKREEQQHSSS